MVPTPADGGPLLDVAGAAAHLGVTVAFIRRLVLEKRVRYYKVGTFVRFRAADLDAFVDDGRQDPVPVRVHVGSPLDRHARRNSAQKGSNPSLSAATSAGVFAAKDD